ncbi:MAG: site-specific integrase [Cognatishimia sp.]
MDAILFLFATGRRKSEVLRLRWSDIDFERRLLRYRRTKTDPMSQGIPPDLIKLLEAMKTTKDSDWLFPNPMGTGPLKDFKKTWAKLIQMADIENFRPHDIRHNVLSAVSAVSDLQTTAAIGGHSSYRSTERYVHARSDVIQNVHNQVTAKAFKILLGDD